ncbi:hypothetical protein HYC85_024940 [Camellia sinensis]|uniref:Bromo domain-containing protein n=1 Tax=Camellia sinensis TaxID=4442 RepID=A0A7J7GDF2_CAMSI|nr:hypothetical protein HYC85_024940 [Camellia sinensis]
MSKRVESEQYYVTFEMFVADVKRMFGNARTYNSPETIYYKCASRHGWKPISLAKFNRVFNLASKSSIDKFQLVEPTRSELGAWAFGNLGLLAGYGAKPIGPGLGRDRVVSERYLPRVIPHIRVQMSYRVS